MRAAILGVGAVGTLLARQLVSSAEVDAVVLRDERTSRVEDVVASLVEGAEVDRRPYLDEVDADVVILCGPSGTHAEAASTFLRRGQPVVSTADGTGDVEALLALDAEARERDLPVVVGAGFAPGLTDVLAAHAAGTLGLTPPTFITLAHLARWHDVDEAMAALTAAAPEFFATRFTTVPGGAVALYHGDIAYLDDEPDPDQDGPRHRLWMVEDGWRYERSRS